MAESKMDLKCGLLGEKLGHSYSPRIHGLLADYTYSLYEKTPLQLESFLRDGDWDGLNVTIPYKRTVVPYCSELSDVAKAIGSVNTLVKRPDGTICGDNTDAYGFWFLLKQTAVNPAGKKVLILGSGGACASVRYVLEQLGAQTVVISRSGENHYGNLERHRDAALVINTTPVGMYPHNGASPVDLRLFPALEEVLDVIYNPARTALMLQAEEMGIRTVNGLSMLVAQAYKSSRAFLTGGISGVSEDADTSLIQRITQALSSEMQNIILIGMPGCGKSTIAQALGKMTGRKVTDLDELFTCTYAVSPEECIRSLGEAKFREMETEVIRSAGKGSGGILATGGGCVTCPENYPLLHQNGRIVWIRRDLSCLETAGRPLSQKTGAREMYQKRKPMYEAFADFIEENTDSPQDAASRILKTLEM